MQGDIMKDKVPSDMPVRSMLAMLTIMVMPTITILALRWACACDSCQNK